MTIEQIDQLMKEHPVLKQICDGKAQYSLALTKLALERGTPSKQERLREIEENLEFLRQAESKYCREHNIPPDYAEPVFDCPLCEDRGWIHYNTKTGEMHHCKCYLDKVHKQIFRTSGLSDSETAKTFESFEFRYYGDEAEQARAKRIVKRCQKFASDVVACRESFSGIGIVGDVGRGKTHLLLSIFNYVIEHNPRLSPIYCVVANLLDDLRGGYEDGAAVSYVERIRRLTEADLLLLDDLGTEHWTDWQESTFYKIINSRMIRNKPIAFSTNLSMEEMFMVVGRRIHSRLYSTCNILTLTGPEDIRLKNKFQLVQKSEQ